MSKKKERSEYGDSQTLRTALGDDWQARIKELRKAADDELEEYDHGNRLTVLLHMNWDGPFDPADDLAFYSRPFGKKDSVRLSQVKRRKCRKCKQTFRTDVAYEIHCEEKHRADG